MVLAGGHPHHGAHRRRELGSEAGGPWSSLGTRQQGASQDHSPRGRGQGAQAVVGRHLAPAEPPGHLEHQPDGDDRQQALGELVSRVAAANVRQQPLGSGLAVGGPGW